MTKLLKMQLSLNVRKPSWLFTLFGAMILIPNYPYIVGVGYLILVVFNYLMFLNQDSAIHFATILPVKRSDIVTSTTWTVVIYELANISLAALMLYPAKLIYPNGNIVGIDANLTYIGIALMSVGMFNLVALPGYFKTGYKCGLPALFGGLALLGTYLVCELAIQLVPTLSLHLDGYYGGSLWARLLTVAIGIGVFALTTYFGNKLAQKRFEKVNL